MTDALDSLPIALEGRNRPFVQSWTDSAAVVGRNATSGTRPCFTQRRPNLNKIGQGDDRPPLSLGCRFLTRRT